MRRSNWPDRTMCLGERITFASKPSECHKKLILINYIHYVFWLALILYTGFRQSSSLSGKLKEREREREIWERREKEKGGENGRKERGKGREGEGKRGEERKGREERGKGTEGKREGK